MRLSIGHLMMGTACAVLLAACGGSSDSPAIEICREEVLNRVSGQMGDVDIKDMAKNTSKLADGNIEIRSQIVLRAGTSEEGTQNFTCTLASEGGTLRLINMQIDFDVKKKSDS